MQLPLDFRHVSVPIKEKYLGEETPAFSFWTVAEDGHGGALIYQDAGGNEDIITGLTPEKAHRIVEARNAWVQLNMDIINDRAPAAEPLKMVLFCPQCGVQHIDKPKPCDMGAGCEEVGKCYAAHQGEPERCPKWDNPPHRSHLCLGCGHIWRPADVPTQGVEHIETRGAADHAPVRYRATWARPAP